MAPLVLGQGWYARRRCTCEQRAKEVRQRETTPRTLAQAVTLEQLGQTYNWLERSWVEGGLEGQTFAGSDCIGANPPLSKGQFPVTPYTRLSEMRRTFRPGTRP
jgi:hypothetical protein